MYAIARFLPEEARRAAVAATYAETVWPGDGRYVRTAAGQCPLGVALSALGHIDWGAPSGGLVADVLGAPEAIDPAWEFIVAWDAGRIDDLADALGVAEGGQR